MTRRRASASGATTTRAGEACGRDRTLGGIIPPQYLVDLYAKASRNGRVFADQVNGSRCPIGHVADRARA
jgi:hypothetical protein